MTIFSILIAVLIGGFALYLLYGIVLIGLAIIRFIFRGFVDLLTLKTLRSELRKFRMQS